jgi:hypothetical protein
MTKTRCGRGGEMEIPLEEGLSLAPRIQNYLEESGIFTYRDLLYWTLKVTDEDSIDAALDIPVILPPPTCSSILGSKASSRSETCWEPTTQKDSEDGEILSAARARETPKLGEVLFAIPLLQFGVG